MNSTTPIHKIPYRATILLFITISFTLMGISPTPQKPPPLVLNNKSKEILREALLEIQKKHPQLDLQNMFHFQQTYCPSELKFLEKELNQKPQKAKKHLKEICNNYLIISNLKQTNPKEYKKNMDIAITRNQGFALALEIKQLKKENINKKKQQELEKKQKELEKIIEKTFTEKQQLQLQEIEKLEKKLKQLKTLLHNQKKNTDKIYRQQYKSLTGEYPPTKQRIKQ